MVLVAGFHSAFAVL